MGASSASDTQMDSSPGGNAVRSTFPLGWTRVMVAASTLAPSWKWTLRPTLGFWPGGTTGAPTGPVGTAVTDATGVLMASATASQPARTSTEHFSNGGSSVPVTAERPPVTLP
ncbi:hypothetical protein KH5H1_04770 [Corallococcus caeni]|uniref:hypothetical protein n=1 Tax=Corallococcus caeni TaxID=3082388 RepID=UPI002957D2A4|nr:hypothetical protein KH5H1_04770 [Corallococcus sp. KH5-1]